VAANVYLYIISGRFRMLAARHRLGTVNGSTAIFAAAPPGEPKTFGHRISALPAVE
jgi:hypothetical protein